MAGTPQAASDGSVHPLWFSPQGTARSRRRALTRERVVTEALAFISADGAQALSMRGLAGRLGVVPGALYRHVRSKEQLQDLIMDGVLAEIDCSADESKAWTEQVTVLAGRLRVVLEDHPGIAALLKTRDLISPHSLALAEAFLAPLHAAGLSAVRAAGAYRLIYDYTIGFALGDPTTLGEQRLRDAQTSRDLRAFLRSLPADRFPALAAIGEYVWSSDRDERFTASLHIIISGLQATERQP